MLLMPTVLLGLAGAFALFQLGLARLELSQLAFSHARAQVIGSDLEAENVHFESKLEGGLLCSTASKTMVLRISETGCYLAPGL
jgi:hypothetical protein